MFVLVGAASPTGSVSGNKRIVSKMISFTLKTVLKLKFQ